MRNAPAATSAATSSVLVAIGQGHATVNALAAKLGVSDNAIRLHLQALERDRLVRRRGMVRSGLAGQPAVEYELTPDGELALSRAYPPAFTALVGSLADRMEARSLRAVFADAGRRLADEMDTSGSGPLGARAEACVKILETLGARATAEVGRRDAVVTGSGCPLAAAVRTTGTTCTLVQALLERHAGVKAVEECEHGDHPRCRFRIRV